MLMPMTGSMHEAFAEAGYWGPIDLLSAAECAVLSRYFDDRTRPKPYEWSKGLGAADRVVYEVATRPSLVSMVGEFLGPEFVLWGASIVDRKPGQEHVWHTDIESSAAESRCVTVWIGLEHTSVESSLKLIYGSHRFGKPLQQAAVECGIARADRTTNAALDLARRLSPDARLVEPEMRDGQALLFDGRGWHGSLNTRVSGRRRALLLQYAAGNVPVRMPILNQFDWPFMVMESPRPPVVTMRGRPARGINRVVRPPARSAISLYPLKSLTRPMPSPLPRDLDKGWKPYPLYRGTTSVLRHLECHASMLEPGHCPHPPHSHLDEELLIVLEGEADIVIATAADDPSPRVERFAAGDMIYYPSYQFHTLRCPGPAPVRYLMYRWQAALGGRTGAMSTTIARASSDAVTEDVKGRSRTFVFEGPTGFLDKLHVHRSRVADGVGYRPHADGYDVAMLFVSGRVRTERGSVNAPAALFYPAGASHGLRGAGAAGAEYLVVEFHGERVPQESRVQRWRRVTESRLRRVRRRIERAMGRPQAVRR
jgi:mannose-6-phosphate isomerase-like protein (cupin superfamily)